MNLTEEMTKYKNVINEDIFDSVNDFFFPITNIIQPQTVTMIYKKDGKYYEKSLHIKTGIRLERLKNWCDDYLEGFGATPVRLTAENGAFLAGNNKLPPPELINIEESFESVRDEKDEHFYGKENDDKNLNNALNAPIKKNKSYKEGYEAALGEFWNEYRNIIDNLIKRDEVKSILYKLLDKNK